MLVRRLLVVLFFFPALAWAQVPATTEPPQPAAAPPPAVAPVDPAAPSDTATPSPTPPAANTPAANTPAAPATPPAPAATQAVLPKDLSVWGMFLAADWVVKAVMIGLVIASVLTWTVFVAKSLELSVAVRQQRRLLAALDSAPSLDKAPSSDLVTAALAEQKLSADTVDDREGLKERVASRLERLEAATGRRMLKGTGLLATIGSTAPFVGLFGTVWGIMNSFIGISRSQTTNLAVVAPGIAEALLATALGLVAAIPAVVIYNHFSRRVTAYRALVGDTSAAVLRLVSRDLGRR
jgi:biopolymer transport protein ExbB